MPHRDPFFIFRVEKPINEIGADAGQDLIYRPETDLARVKLVTRLDRSWDGQIEGVLAEKLDHLRPIGQSGPTERSALQYLLRAFLRHTASIALALPGLVA